jgi:colicin import membrane protein
VNAYRLSAAAFGLGLVTLVGGRALGLVGDGDNRSAAAKLIGQVEAVPAHAALAREPLARARHGLSRAEDTRAAGDRAHAAMLEALGREWAETGNDLVRAAQAEKKLGEIQLKTADLEAKAVRARALVEQTVARRGRAQEKLEQLERAGQKGRP